MATMRTALNRADEQLQRVLISSCAVIGKTCLTIIWLVVAFTLYAVIVLVALAVVLWALRTVF